VNGIFHGKGIMYFNNGTKYVGWWIENKKSGNGMWTCENGEKYEGQTL
jgi:hypothetical protein